MRYFSLLISIIIFAFSASGQVLKQAAIKNISVDYDGEKTVITYDIEGGKLTDRYFVEVGVYSNGVKRTAKSITGDLGQGVAAGKGKKIYWNQLKDGYVLDEKINVEIKASVQSPLRIGSATVKSMLLPGWGDYTLRPHKHYFVYSLATIGTVGAGAYYYWQSNQTYGKYKGAFDINQNDDLFTQANNERYVSYALFGAAITIWAIDVIALQVKAKKMKKSLQPINGKYYLNDNNAERITANSPQFYINTKTQYDKQIDIGNQLLTEGKYNGAKSAFLEAQKLKPGELVPEMELEKIEKILAGIQATEDEYNKVMKEGNNLLAVGNYVAAKAKYKSALTLKSGDEVALEKIKEVEKIETGIVNAKRYDELIASGNSAYTRKEYEIAITYFTDASKLFPDRALPKVKIEELQSLLDKQKTEKYKTKLAEAEMAMENKEYTRAKTLFEEASAMKPYEEYPKNRIAMIEATIREANGGSGLVALFKKCKGSVFFVIFPGRETISYGSGFFISEDGLAISNYHVFKGESVGSEIIRTEDGSNFSVSEVLEKDEEKDYIIFRVKKERPTQKFPFAPYSKTAPEIGEKVFAIGNPEGLEKTLADGIVSGFREGEDLIQITVPITHGSSGGPLFNMNGEVVGITSGGLNVGNLNFAVNIQKLRLSRYKKTITY